MRPRQFMGLAGDAAEAGLRAKSAAVRNSLQKDAPDFPLIVANLPATAQQKAVAVGVAILLAVAAAGITPFANIQLGRVDAFIPVLQTCLGIVDLITAALLFAQYSIQPQRALLALASGYMCSGSFAFLQTLAFPGGYAPAGLIGDGPNSPAWIYVLWHTTFPAAILVYAFTKDAAVVARPGRSAMATIGITIACTIVVIAGLTWIVTTKTELLPSFYLADVRVQTALGNQVNVGLLLWCATALAVLLFRNRTILDLWLMLTLLAYSPNFLVAIIGSSVRFSVGWYAARCFVLVGSCMLLTVLLIETMVLYSRLANSLTLQRRERTNRLLSLEAVTGAIAHELRTPLGAIALNASTALSQLRSAPPELEGMEDVLNDIEADSHRAAGMIKSIREMTTKTMHRSAQANAEEAAQLTLRLLSHDLQLNHVSVTVEFQGNLPDVQFDPMELQQVLLNLIRNAIDAMQSSHRGARRLHVKSSLGDQSTVLLLIQDSGPGISIEDRQRIFDPFFTTKSDGMGLGLAISSTLVANSGGKLTLIKSDSDGSIFALAMPVSRELRREVS
ncbi:signal transduction histidine kinase [Bradyrhizobium sp. AZCC 2262]|uniref:sensor histidine kinase n=1 Tax=Bradyrhizobium sp. AZCC 2262 TaxID=3117022 RepID=UPI002FEF3E95